MSLIFHLFLNIFVVNLFMNSVIEKKHPVCPKVRLKVLLTYRVRVTYSGGGGFLCVVGFS